MRSALYRYISTISIAVLVASLFGGCAPGRPILIDFGYQLPKSEMPLTSSTTVAVSPFKDMRGETGSVVGKRLNELNGQTRALVVQGTVSEKVNAALRTALKTRTSAVKDAPAWDLTESGISASGADLQIGGEIKSLWVESTSQLASTTSTATVQLRVVVADAVQKKIIRILNVNSKIERENVANTDAFIERALSEAITGAIDQVFVDEELKNRFK